MAWVKYPTVTIDTPLGAVQAAFTEADHVSVTTDAHVNDDRPTIVYRGRDYLIHLHLYASRGWTQGDYAPSVKSRDNWSDAPRTYRQAIIDTVSDAVRAYAVSHPEVLRAAEYADAHNDAESLEKEANELAEKLADVRKRARAERKREAYNAPTL